MGEKSRLEEITAPASYRDSPEIQQCRLHSAQEGECGSHCSRVQSRFENPVHTSLRFVHFSAGGLQAKREVQNEGKYLKIREVRI